MSAAAIAERPKATTTPNTPLQAMPTPPAFPPSASTVYEIPVDLIVRSETNRQPQFDDDWVESIRRGVDTPVLVRPIKATLEHCTAVLPHAPFTLGQTILKLVYGERRWAASKQAGKKTIPAIVRELTDTEALEIQVRENEHRQDYDAMDRAAAYAHLRAQYMKDHHGEKGFTEGKCCDLIAQACKNDKIKGRTVQQIIALGKLSPECREALRKGEMEASHGYELSRRSEAEQLELLKWLRRETLHGQGDIPVVRRLKREISEMDRIAEEQKLQEKLFKDPQPGTSTTKVPTVDDQLYAKALEVVREAKLHRMNDPQFLERNLKIQPAAAHQLFVRLEKEGIVTPRNAHSERSYIFPKTESTPAQTSAPAETKTVQAGFAGTRVVPVKPLSAAQLKKEADRAAKESREFKRRQDEHERNERIEKEYRALFFASLAKKAQINSRLLTHVVPTMIFEIWENELPIEAFAQEVLLWPAPKDGHAYSYEEVEKHSAKHTRKFTGGLLAAMILTLYMNDAEKVKIAKYMGVDPKKLRQKAAAAVKEEDEAEKPKAKGQKPKAGVK